MFVTAEEIRQETQRLIKRQTTSPHLSTSLRSTIQDLILLQKQLDTDITKVVWTSHTERGIR